ncbi:MAG: YdcF family protein [Haliea sp.]|nr:MAG: YdcF family protein [Haliea sp.]
MEYGELKPILTALAVPPAAPLLLAFLGLLLARRWSGRILIFLGLGSLWLVSCNAVAVWLASALLAFPPPVTPERMKAADVQAIVVLGGGVLPEAPEYGQAQPSAHTLARLRLGVWMARQTGKPLAFSGGVGWSAAGTGTANEGAVAERVLRNEYGILLQWNETASRDTAENAQLLWKKMEPSGMTRIALVTDAWHIPRAALEFRRAGFEVLPAPTGYAVARERPVLEWLPSAHGLAMSRQVVREWLGLQVARF